MDLAPRLHSLADLLRIMERLRDPEHGCPWDVAQTFQSIVPSTIEECYELAAAIEDEDYDHVADELGDVLFQGVFYAQLGKEQGLFEFSTVIHALAEKLLRRHPHVFAGGDIEARAETSIDSAQVRSQWETIKAEERRHRAKAGALADVPVALPSLPRAQKLQKRAARVGFDWTDPGPVFAKVREELEELAAAQESLQVERNAVAGGTPTPARSDSDALQRQQDAVEEELGDLLFAVVDLARHLKIDSESALRKANRKFEDRFQHMEDSCERTSCELENLDAAQLEALWEQAKRSER